ncbi:Uu.00g112930.m01.CDS01 [Anthostomella pinea]|uniref:Uu.00g112930.m01.CDS01 n=1 Tax=Anthostomella pinea TaxID=933095 RepID=A0AAI8YGH5_9PEZI|nr:Uu.00g112930.m01.CDS01 [Anthostomella pinea]
MLEPWDEVLTLQRERKLCAEDVQTIKAECARDHGKIHVVECPDCWTRLLNRMRDRYLNSATKEWFSGRRAFLQELDTLFTRAHQHDVDFRTIDQRIYDEKKDWYRDKVRSLNLHKACQTPAEARALQQKLNDRSITADQLASDLQEAFSDGAVRNEEVFNGFIDALRAAKSPKARTDAYIDIFFQPNHDVAGAAKSQKYMDMVANGMPIADAINAMLRDRQLAKGHQDEEKHQLLKKYEELKRAKAAHELDRAKKDKARQDRARAAAAASRQHDEHQLPPCAVCLKKVDAKDFSACPLCQLLAEHFGVRREPVVFCSQECNDAGYRGHMQATHECASGMDCVQLHDEDVDMDAGPPVVVFCRECVESLGVQTIFCSARCYADNFQQHRDLLHLIEREKARLEVDDKGQLEFDPQDRSRYRARKIEDHIVTLPDAMAAWQRKSGAIVLP